MKREYDYEIFEKFVVKNPIYQYLMSEDKRPYDDIYRQFYDELNEYYEPIYNSIFNEMKA